jgi:hypothetical protein
MLPPEHSHGSRLSCACHMQLFGFFSQMPCITLSALKIGEISRGSDIALPGTFISARRRGAFLGPRTAPYHILDWVDCASQQNRAFDFRFGSFSPVTRRCRKIGPCPVWSASSPIPAQTRRLFVIGDQSGLTSAPI